VRPESVEIKVTIAGDHVGEAVSTLGLTGAATWKIVFCEDVTSGAASTPLLDLGVVLRAREKSATKGDSTVKLRPCRWSQLDGQYFHNDENDATELKIEADWAGPRRQLATSMTTKWSDRRMSTVEVGDRPVAGLFTDEQRDFLTRCAPGRINLSAVTALPAFTATRWDTFPATSEGLELSVRAERWTIEDGDDFLELSIVSSVDRGLSDQTALHSFVSSKGLTVDDSPDNKTRRVLSTLVARTDT
jgi:hypothetical protein